MIEQIQGKLIKKSPTFCVVDCHGVGLGVFISLNTYEALNNSSDTIELLTYLHVRDDALQLFGFTTEEERNVFRMLVSISGIGPKLAITILSGLSVQELTEAIASEDYMQLTQIPGVGKKTAQRVVLELKEKVAAGLDLAISREFPKMPAREGDKVNEAFLALIALGYKQPDARKAIHKVIQNNSADLSVEEMVKLALKEV
ncbi:MAG: Holliday junction branch migration protein RuvA [Calditrichota bacterium]|jgi:Holliday junction DNA helicase RuvA